MLTGAKDVIEKVQTFTDFVIVVDDKSTDETIKEVKKTDAILFQHQVNLGYDSALERGILEAIKIKSDIIKPKTLSPKNSNLS